MRMLSSKNHQAHKIDESALISFNITDPHKVHICDLDIEFCWLLRSNFLEHYNCKIDFNKKTTCDQFRNFTFIQGNSRHNFWQYTEINTLQQNEYNQHNLHWLMNGTNLQIKM